MPLKPGTRVNFSNSMAAAMEQALEREWLSYKQTALPDFGRDELRLMFAAIAQGVVEHLKQHAADSFDIAVDVTQTIGGTDNAPLVDSTNPSWISTGGGWGFSANTVDVTQVNAPNNMVRSRGTGTITRIRTDPP